MAFLFVLFISFWNRARQLVHSTFVVFAMRVFCSMVRWFPVVLIVVNAILTFVSLNNLVIKLVSLPIYVNFAHFCICTSWFCLLFLCNISMGWASCLLLARICRMVSFSFFLFSVVSLYVSSLLRQYLMATDLCSLGWHESLGIIMSAVVGFL